MRLNSRELGSLTNSIANDGKNCQTAMRFIPFEKVPKNKPITYRKFNCTIRPHKKEIRRVRMVTGGDKLSYDGPATTETGKITTAKFLFNSIILTKNSKLASLDIKDFYLTTNFTNAKDKCHMRVPYNLIPDDIKKAYNLDLLVHNNHIYCEIRKGMYSLKHAGPLALTNSKSTSFQRVSKRAITSQVYRLILFGQLS